MRHASFLGMVARRVGKPCHVYRAVLSVLLTGTKMFSVLLPGVFSCFASPECSKLCLEGGQLKAQFAGCFMVTNPRQIPSAVVPDGTLLLPNPNPKPKT